MHPIRSAFAALNSAKYAYKAPESAVDYLVVGGGVIGLAIARSISEKFPTKSTIVVERHTRAVGTTISSRNSEVIHSGLYYPPDSLKTRLCIRGRELLYDRYKSHTRKAHLWCPETGIVDSHTLMESLEKDILDSEGGDLVYATRVVRVDPYSQPSPASPDIGADQRGWVVQMVTGEGEGDAIFTKTLINAAGLSAPLIVNSLLPEAKRLPLFYNRGSYAKYSGPGISGVSHLVYPCPETDANAHGFQSLGTHLTLDFQGNVRFGPDSQWISPAEGEGPDFWMKHLVPDDSRLEEMHRAVTKYLPEVTFEGLQLDYVGIRPKLVGPQGGFQDFVFRKDYPAADAQSQNRPLISLLGIESPGLTSSLAIAEHVVENML
ncbi:NAD dehydrogenase [Mycena filopes]|nr:NAD dehydrogenase [Mycena filopes]